MSLQSDLPCASAAADARLNLLRAWLTTLHLVQPETIRPASADASFRRYFRVDVLPSSQGALGRTLIVMDAPPQQEDVRPFIQVAGVFGVKGVSVPSIVAQNVAQGFLLLSDLGSRTYLQHLTVDTANAMYTEALEALIKIQLQSQPGVLPEYDRAKLLGEMQLFPQWYIGQHLGHTLSDVQTAQLDGVFEALLSNILAQQQVYVHRDYHSRNLMLIDEGNPGILDFQDAVFGPITYDLASLLRDAYVQWDEATVLDWVVRYWQRAKQLGLPVNPDIDAFYRDFEFMGMQRHLKILGIFCRLNYRDGKALYLNDLPLVLDYVRKAANRYAALKPLVRLLDTVEGTAPQVRYTF